MSKFNKTIKKEIKMKNICKALLIAQKDFETVYRKGKNPRFNNVYATLPDVLNAVLPSLRENNILFSASEVSLQDKPFMQLRLIHTESGEFLENHVSLLGLTDMQKLGSAYTYATRYGLLSMLGISPDLDDDGNLATNNPTHATNIKQANVESSPDTTKLTAHKKITYEGLMELYELKKKYLSKEDMINADKVINEKDESRYNALYAFLRSK